jgi:hypothetical protein
MFTNFLNKTNGQTLARKSRNAYIVGRGREYSYLLKFCNVLAIPRINVSDNKLIICYRFIRLLSIVCFKFTFPKATYTTREASYGWIRIGYLRIRIRMSLFTTF